jgi:hypothetical protein
MLDKHKYFETHFKNYGTYYSISFLRDSGNIAKKEVDKIDEKRGLKIDNVLQGLQPYVKTIKKSFDSTYFYDDKNKELFLSFKYQNNDAELVKSIEEFYNSRTKDTTIAQILARDFSHNVPIAAFMRDLKFDGLFENIILFDKSKVYYQTKPDNLSEINNPNALSDSAKDYQAGVYIALDISGLKKHIMILPIDMIGGKFYVAGFIPDDEYLNKTRTINKQLLMFIAAVLLLVFTSIPVLKIFFIDDRERLKARDATNSALSLLFGIGLFILLIIGFSKKQFVDTTIQHKRIHAISDTLNSYILRDIEAIKTLGKAIAHKRDTVDTTLAGRVVEALQSTSFTQDPMLRSPFPLNEIILIDKKGIVQKGYTSTPFSDMVKVDLSGRQYFRNIDSIDFSWPTSDGNNFYIESIKSFNTAKYETAISFRNPDPKLPVLAITAKIPSLYDQVLPNDVEFLVIDQRGRVLYHSIQAKNLHENFLKECESDVKLINAIRWRTEAETIIKYNENKWLARIVPIKETRFYHVTLLNLNQTDTKNARIFLITFYFLVASLILMIIGLLIIRWITRAEGDKQKYRWFLNWLVLKPRKYLIYKRLSVILVFIVILQLFGFRFASDPISQFVYQLIFLTFTLFISMVFLNITESEGIKTAWFKFFTEFLVLLATLFLIVVFVLLGELSSFQIIPLAGLLGIISFNYKFFKKDVLLKLETNNTTDVLSAKVKRTYLVFLFLFLLSITGVPVLRYYFSVKNFEQTKSQREQLMEIGSDNIALLSVSDPKNFDTDWFKRIQGNNIDFLQVDYLDDVKDFDILQKRNSNDTSLVNQIYEWLPDPVTNWYNRPKLLDKSEYVVSVFSNDTLYYKKGDDSGAIEVKYARHKNLFTLLHYMVLIFFMLLIVGLSCWHLLKFLAKVLLNLNQEKPELPDDPWLEILKNDDKKRILLKSFNGSVYLEKSTDYFDPTGTGNDALKIIKASEIIEPDFPGETILKGTPRTIWICGFNHIVHEIDKHEKLLSFLIKLNQCSTFRIIVDLSFDIDLIYEFYDDYVAENELKPEQETQLYVLRKKWDNFFEGYLIYNGFINQNKLIDTEILRVEDNYLVEQHGPDLHLQFSKIWSNLTSYEKIVLFDLADDGLLNRKNEKMIQKLIDKRLIVTDPEPEFYADEFRDFVRNSMKTKEVKAIESKLGLKGSWHNAKYLIFMILVPLAAFVIISQGISIEKVFGIFAGGLALITGIIRLFDSNTFRS